MANGYINCLKYLIKNDYKIPLYSIYKYDQLDCLKLLIDNNYNIPCSR